jgi:hypothetical protein
MNKALPRSDGASSRCRVEHIQKVLSGKSRNTHRQPI